MLRLENISKSYSRLLFSEVSLTLGMEEKVGLVGLNGCGKTTLFKIISGEEDPDDGAIILTEESVALLPQVLDFQKGMLVGGFLEGLVGDPRSEMHRVNEILSRLGILEIDHYKEIAHLSDGQRMKLYMVSMIHDRQNASRHSSNSPILLLDEPTNHLDIEGILWLENFVNSYDGIMIIISHDRAFLNNVTDMIIEIDEHTLYKYSGNYDEFLEQKTERIELRRKQYVRQEKKREQLENLISRAMKIGDGKKRGRAVGAAKKRLYREVERDEVDLYKRKQIKEFGIAGSVHRTKKMLDVKSLEFAYEKGRPVVRDTDFLMLGGEKVWLFGPNGSGKTTFIKLLIGELKQNEGAIKWGNDVSFAYFSQDQSHMPMGEKVAQYFMDQTGVTFERSFGALDRFLFDKSQRDITIKMLSPGQRARLSFAVFAQKDYDFMILDEPTNHLDIETKELIEVALNEFQGNILLISHDRYFVESIEPDRAVTFKDGVLTQVSDLPILL